MNQSTSSRNNGKNRRKLARTANRKKQQTKTNTQSNNNHTNDKSDEEIIDVTETTSANKDDEEPESSVQQTDDEKEQDETSVHTDDVVSPPTHIHEGQQTSLSMKQQQKPQSINSMTRPATREEPFIPSRPQASVAPVKQSPLSTQISSTNHFKSSQIPPEHNSRFNGNTPSYNICTFSGHNPLPPRFQQQRQEKEAAAAAAAAADSHQRYRKRRGPFPPKRSPNLYNSPAQTNDFVSSPPFRQQQQQQIHNNPPETSLNCAQHEELSIPPDYSSESENLSDVPSTTENTSSSPLLSTSAGSQYSLRGIDLIRSLSSSNCLSDDLMSICDNASFSFDELEQLISKIATKHILNKQEAQRLLTSAKSDKSIERILDETYVSQIKILAIELQAEKHRVLELTKTNADMDHIIRQLQQQQQPIHSLIQYQQMFLSFQMQLRRLADENARLQHQLHAYSMMPASINELKQQHLILDEQLRQLTIRNSALENEAAESERASKHAAEIYKKADSKKQERIEQMIADINKYKKLDKELTSLRQKHNELEKHFNTKTATMSDQRKNLQEQCEQFKEQIQLYEQLQIKYEKLLRNQSTTTKDELEQELNDLRVKNDQLRQQNWKVIEEINRLSHEQE